MKKSKIKLFADVLKKQKCTRIKVTLTDDQIQFMEGVAKADGIEIDDLHLCLVQIALTNLKENLYRSVVFTGAGLDKRKN